LRQDFRDFRLDRVAGLEMLADSFTDERGRTLRDLPGRDGPDALSVLSE